MTNEQQVKLLEREAEYSPSSGAAVLNVCNFNYDSRYKHPWHSNYTLSEPLWEHVIPWLRNFPEEVCFVLNEIHGMAILLGDVMAYVTVCLWRTLMDILGTAYLHTFALSLGA
jgi:hypothetical protein